MQDVFEPTANFEGEVFEPMNFNRLNKSIKIHNLQRKVFNEISEREPKYLPFVKLLKSISRKFNYKDIISYEKELKEINDIYNYESINYATNKKIKNKKPNYKQFENLFFAMLNAYKKKYKKVFVFTGIGFSDSELYFLDNMLYLTKPKPFTPNSILKDLIIVSFNKKNNFDGEEIADFVDTQNNQNTESDKNILDKQKKVVMVAGICLLAVGITTFFLLRRK